MSALTPSVKPLGLISTFVPIGMLDLGWTMALTPSVKRALLYYGNFLSEKTFKAAGSLMNFWPLLLLTITRLTLPTTHVPQKWLAKGVAK